MLLTALICAIYARRVLRQEKYMPYPGEFKSTPESRAANARVKKLREAKTHFQKYGIQWEIGTPDWLIHIACIRNGGRWIDPHGITCGEGNFFHYKELQKIIWPRLQHHRWSDLILFELLENQVTAILGPKSSGKTHVVARFALTDYWCFPDNTSILVSSTTLPSLELRIWGEIKKLFREGKKNIPSLSGHLIDHKHLISTEALTEENDVRDLRNGIIGVACKQGNADVGLSNYVGIKNDRVKLYADECQFMAQGFLEVISNLDSNEDFKAGLLGNPVDPTDPLGQAAEPFEGWQNKPEPEKTECWDTRFHRGRAINLVGTDSPNFDVPEEDAPPFPKLINRRMIENVVAFWGADSHQYYSQCKGVMKMGVHAHRVLTASICLEHHAFDAAQWKGPNKKRLYAMDVAYGSIGGDRCMGIPIEFGPDETGRSIIDLGVPELVPVSVKARGKPEDQIAEWTKLRLEQLNIPPNHLFYDSTGRGTMGAAFARVFGSTTPDAIEFGGKATQRPVDSNLYIQDNEGRSRLKRCDEHFSKFVTELWFCVRYVVESEQLRGMTREIAREFELREWGLVSGGRVEVESKVDTRERTNRSPDIADCVATGLEGARRMGFQIMRIGAGVHVETANQDWLDKLSKKHYDRVKSRQLKFAPSR